MKFEGITLPVVDGETEFRAWLAGRVIAAHAERNAAFDECLTRPCSGNFDGRSISNEVVNDAIRLTQDIYETGLPVVLQRLEATGCLNDRLVREALGGWAMIVVGGFDTIRAALFYSNGSWETPAHRAVQTVSDQLLEERSALFHRWLERVATEERKAHQVEEHQLARNWILGREGNYKAAWMQFRQAFPSYSHAAFLALWKEVRPRGKGRPRK